MVSAISMKLSFCEATICSVCNGENESERFFSVQREVTMQSKINLVRATKKDVKMLHRLQVEAFLPLYEKYHDDDTNPAKEPEDKLRKKLEDINGDFYIIYNEDMPVGGVRVNFKKGNNDVVTGNVKWISPLFIIPEYQNRGIAQEALKQIFELYSDTISWRLYTIKQEAGNCHLYEKCGFVRVGEEKNINDKMALIKYEKQTSYRGDFAGKMLKK